MGLSKVVKANDNVEMCNRLLSPVYLCFLQSSTYMIPHEMVRIGSHWSAHLSVNIADSRSPSTLEQTRWEGSTQVFRAGPGSDLHEATAAMHAVSNAGCTFLHLKIDQSRSLFSTIFRIFSHILPADIHPADLRLVTHVEKH